MNEPDAMVPTTLADAGDMPAETSEDWVGYESCHPLTWLPVSAAAAGCAPHQASPPP
jgi:hypothetical protein